MSAQTLDQVVASCRAIVGDTGTGRNSLNRLEQPSGKINGTNKRFQVTYFPIVASSFSLLKNGAPLADPADYTVDLDTGIITLVVALVPGTPPTGSMDIVEATYSFIWFNDNEYYEFIAAAGTSLDVDGLGATPQAIATDVVFKIGDNVLDALKQLVGYHFNNRRADEYAHRFSSSAGGQSVNVDVVTTNFRNLAKQFYENGIKSRDDVYTRRGKRSAPAAAQVTMLPIPSPSGPLGSPRR